MDPKPITWVLDAAGGRAQPGAGGLPGVEIHGVSTDSRTIRGGDLFVAIRGERFDGHDHVADAFGAGAAAAIIERDVHDLGGFRDRAVLRVADTRATLGRIARHHREELDAEIVAITGSNGKTTVKDMIAHLTTSVGPVVAAEKSFNNDLGLPLTLLRMDRSTRVGILEMGTNAPGEIAALCRIAAPDIGVVTNVAEAHLEGLGGILGVAEEKGALVDALPRCGMAFLNHEDFHCREMARRAGAAAVRFGFDPSAELWGLRRRRTAEGISFYLYGKMEIRVPVPGLHNAMNALVAAGVAMRLGVSPAEIQARFRSFWLPEMRLTRREIAGVTIVNDAYNANPGSVGGAIEELRAARTDGRRVLVIGDMCELGEYTARLHRQVGRRAARAGIDVIWAVGEHAPEVERGARAVARWTGEIVRSSSTELAVGAVPMRPAPGDVVVVKGSRRMRLELVADRLAELAAGETVSSVA